MSLPNTSTLTAAQQGILIAANLTILPTLGDTVNTNPDGYEVAVGCCPQCCSRCAVTDELDRAGTLDEVVTWAPQDQWRDTKWWRDGRVDRVWLYGVLACPNQCSEPDRAARHSPVTWMLMNIMRRLDVTHSQARKLVVDRLQFERAYYDEADSPLDPVLAQL